MANNLPSYNKPALTISQQIERLKARGLIIPDEKKAHSYLSNISFYRLRAYTYPYQDNNDPNHPFTKEISFDEIINLYVFDRKLRLLLLDAIEKIEISFRTKLIYEYSLKHVSDWYCRKEYFLQENIFVKNMEEIDKELNRSKEDFIDHYNKTYNISEYPPSWMTLEVISLGLLSKIYKNINNTCGTKRKIASLYGLKSESTLESWMQCLSIVRNTCAHHSRVWNRRLLAIAIPNNPINRYVANKPISPYKLYSYLCCIVYILNIINPEHTFIIRLKNLMNEYPVFTLKEMGFPNDWEKDPFWRS